MARKIAVFIAASLDGYIATREDSLAWLMQVQGEGDNGYAAFMATVDTVVMGKRTYDWLLREVGVDQFPYRDQQCYVFTHHPTQDDGRAKYVHEPVEQFAKRLQAQSGGDIWLVGGGSLLSIFHEAHLIDEWIVTIAPILLGDGIPLFHKHSFQTPLRLMDARTYGQFAALRYTVEPGELSNAPFPEHERLPLR